MNRRLRLVASGACALLSAALCLAYGEHVRSQSERLREEALERYGGEVVTLVVATEGIEVGESVSRVNVAEREWLVDLAPANAVTGLDSVLGTEVSVPVAAGVPLTELNFRDSAESVEVPPDRVALSVPLDDDLGVPPGTAVGASLAAYEADEDGVRMSFEDVRVLAVPKTGTRLMGSGSITVAVAPDDVARLLAASDAGCLRLALPGDEALALAEGEQSAPESVPAEKDGEDEAEDGEAEDTTGEDDAS